MRQPRPRPDQTERARARYFNRQAVLPADLTQDQAYFLDALRRHNRLFHGWGVLFGLTVEKVGDKATSDELRKKYGVDLGVDPKGQPWVIVLPGYALTPGGDEIVLTCPVFVNVRLERPDGSLVTAPSDCQPATGERAMNRPDGGWALTAEAWEEPTGAVRAAQTRCGDGPDHFEFSRTQDTIVFRLARLAKPGDQLPLPYPDHLPPYPDHLPSSSRPVRVLRGVVAPKRDAVRIATVNMKAEMVDTVKHEVGDFDPLNQEPLI